MIASIGNDNSKVSKNYPASFNTAIGIAATDLNDRKASFSNYGPAADVAAPGEALISAYPGGLYAAWSGTSAAAALVSGEAALLLGLLAGADVVADGVDVDVRRHVLLQQLGFGVIPQDTHQRWVHSENLAIRGAPEDPEGGVLDQRAVRRLRAHQRLFCTLALGNITGINNTDYSIRMISMASA